MSQEDQQNKTVIIEDYKALIKSFPISSGSSGHSTASQNAVIVKKKLIVWVLFLSLLLVANSAFAGILRGGSRTYIQEAPVYADGADGYFICGEDINGYRSYPESGSCVLTRDCIVGFQGDTYETCKLAERTVSFNDFINSRAGKQVELIRVQVKNGDAYLFFKNTQDGHPGNVTNVMPSFDHQAYLLLMLAKLFAVLGSPVIILLFLARKRKQKLRVNLHPKREAPVVPDYMDEFIKRRIQEIKEERGIK